MLLDCKTRWNTIIPMIRRFLLLRHCINKTLIEEFNPIILDVIENVVKILDSIVKNS